MKGNNLRIKRFYAKQKEKLYFNSLSIYEINNNYTGSSRRVAAI